METRAEQLESRKTLQQLRDQLQLALDASRLGMWDWNVQTGELIWSARCRELFGVSTDQRMSYTAFLNLLHPDDRTATDQAVKKAIETHADFDAEFRTNERNGKWTWILSKGRPYYDASGRPNRLVGTMMDVTERKEAERAAREAERRARLIFNQQFQFMTLLSEKGEILDINEPPIRLIHARREDLIGKIFWETPFWRDLPEMQRQWPIRLAEAAARNETLFSEDSYRGEGGTIRIAAASITPVRDAHGRLELFLVQASDITERKQAEASLRESEYTLRTFYQSAPLLMGVVELTTDNRIVHLYDNPATIQFLNQVGSEGKSAEEMGAPADAVSQWVEAYREAARRNGPHRFEYLHQTSSGPRWLSAVVTPISDVSHRHKRFCYVAEEITERKQTEAALRESETRMRAILNTAIEGIITIDHRGFIEQLNPAAERIFGYNSAELTGKNVSCLMPAPDRVEHDRYLLNYLQTGERKIIGIGREVLGMRKDG
ncbi:MAG: PAS domain-containing protein, partial [Limisphaerales bacterium]